MHGSRVVVLSIALLAGCRLEYEVVSDGADASGTADAGPVSRFDAAAGEVSDGAGPEGQPSSADAEPEASLDAATSGEPVDASAVDAEPVPPDASAGDGGDSGDSGAPPCYDALPPGRCTTGASACLCDGSSWQCNGGRWQCMCGCLAGELACC